MSEFDIAELSRRLDRIEARMNNDRFQRRQEFMRDTVSQNNIAGESRRHHHYSTRNNGCDHSNPICAPYNDHYATDFTDGDCRDNYGNDNYEF